MLEKAQLMLKYATLFASASREGALAIGLFLWCFLDISVVKATIYFAKEV